MNAKYAPGPWVVDQHNNINAGGRMVAFPAISGGLNQQANARLIAAAPELLEALQALIDMDVAYKRGPVVEQAVERAQAAIAKATGEQS